MKGITNQYITKQMELGFTRVNDWIYNLSWIIRLNNYMDETGYASFKVVREAERLIRAGIYAPVITKQHLVMAYDYLKDITREEICDYLDECCKDNVCINDALLDMFEKNISKGTKSVLVTEYAYFLHRLFEMVEKYPKVIFTITYTDSYHREIIKFLFKENKNVLVKGYNPYTDVGLSEDDSFDLIMSIPKQGKYDGPRKTKYLSREMDLVAFENLQNYLASDGRLCIVVKNRRLGVNGPMERVIHKFQDQFALVELNLIPIHSVFTKGSGYLLYGLLKRRTTEAPNHEIILKHWSFGEEKVSRGRKTKEDSLINYTDKELVMEHEMKIPARIYLEKLDGNLNLAIDDKSHLLHGHYETLSMEDVVDVKRGINYKKIDMESDVSFINISHIEDSEIQYDELAKVKVYYEDSFARHLAKDGDVLITVRGTTLKVARFEDPGYPCLVSANLMILRPKKDKIRSDYLTLMLQSPMGQIAIKNLMQGHNLYNLSVKDVRSLLVPYVSLDEQNELMEENNLEYAEYKKAMEAAREKWSNAKNKVYAYILNGGKDKSEKNI